MNHNLLIVGSKAVWAIETYYAKHLNNYGLKTTIFDCSSFYSPNSITSKIRARFFDLTLYKNVNKSLIKFCIDHKPTLVWVFKGIELYPETLNKISSLGIILINYNPDHPFIRTSVTHGGKNIEECLPLYKVFFSYRKDLVSYFSKTFNAASHYLPFGFEIADEVYNSIRKEAEIKKLCFIGTPDKERVEWIIKLADLGFSIDLFSLSYQNKRQLLKNKNISTHDVVLGLDYWKHIYKYRVQLNFFRKHNIGSHNQRTFEVPGVGGILLTPFNEEQVSFFESNKECFFYNDFLDLAEKAEQILKISDNDILTSRDAARKRSVDSEYSYMGRSKIVLNALLKI